MKADDSLRQLKALLKSLNTSFEVDQLGSDFDLFAYGALDSLIMIQYVVAIENHFKIHLENEDITYDRFRTFNDLNNTLLKKYLKDTKP